MGSIEPIWDLFSNDRNPEAAPTSKIDKCSQERAKMGYSSDVTDKEWEIIEPLLPIRKKTRPPIWTKREILNGILYQLKNGCNWSDLPKDFPPYSTVFWHYQQWYEEGAMEKMMRALHHQARAQVKKTAVDDLNYH